MYNKNLKVCKNKKELQEYLIVVHALIVNDRRQTVNEARSAELAINYGGRKGQNIHIFNKKQTQT